MATTKKKNKTKQRISNRKKPAPRPVIGRSQEIALLVIILLLTFGLRMIRVDSPLLDFHAHRQTHTASIAQGYYDHTFNILKPVNFMIDGHGNTPGAIETEFPIYQYIVGMIWRVVGMHDFVGRLLSIFFGMGVAYYLYLLTRRYFGPVAALGATTFYAINPVAIFFNRTFQVDTLVLLFFVGGIYHLSGWFDTRTRRDIVAATVLTAVGLAIKPPVLLILAPWILYELYKNQFWRRVNRKDLLVFIGYVAVAGMFATAWFLYAYFDTFKATGLSVIRGRLNEPIRTTEYWFSAMLYIETMKRFLILLTPIGTLLFAGALVPMFRHPRGKMLTTLFVGYLLYFIIMAEYNLPHYYYQLPFLPIASIYIGWLVAWIVDRAKKNEMAQLLGSVALIAILVSTAFLSYREANPWYNIDHAPFILEAAEKTKEITGPGARIWANSLFWGDFYYYTNSYMPWAMFFEEANEFSRWGHNYNEETGEFATEEDHLQNAKKLGVEYVVWLKHRQWRHADKLTPNKAELLLDTPTFAIWRIGDKG